MKPLVLKGQIEPAHSSVAEDTICRLTLSDNRLLVERAEHGKGPLQPYDIPLRLIRSVQHLNPDIERVNPFRRLGNMFSDFANHVPEDVPEPDILKIEFSHYAQDCALTFRLLEGSAKDMVRRWNRLCGGAED